VAESGTGYTLSGKPLDPQSAAARPYLQRGGHAAATTADVVADDAPASAKTDGPRPAPARARVPRERVASLKRPVEDDSEDDDEESGGGGYTLRRKQAPHARWSGWVPASSCGGGAHARVPSELHTLVRCRPYGDTEAEPFAVHLDATGMRMAQNITTSLRPKVWA
jgi:hypothetical protein